MLLNKEILIGIYESSSFDSFDLWQFTNYSGTILNEANLSFDSSTAVQIDWGDGSVETVTSDVNYTHTFV
jgi:hypothetical protein